MKFTRTLFASVFGLSAMPLSLALELAPDAMLIQDSVLSSGAPGNAGCTDDAPCTGEGDDPYILGSTHEVACCCGLGKKTKNRDPKHGHPRQYFLCERSTCYDNVHHSASDPFKKTVCYPIYVTPEQADNTDPLDVPTVAAQLLVDVSVSIATEDPFALFATLFSLPGLFVHKDDTPTYKVNSEFMEAMQRNVRNYVAQELTERDMRQLYSGIRGNSDELDKTTSYYRTWLRNKNDPDVEPHALTDLTGQFGNALTHFFGRYEDYENSTPWDSPQEANGGSKTGVNGYGMYYSAFVSQMLIALMHKIIFYRSEIKKSESEQEFLVDYVWRAIKHSQELVDTYVEQRERAITDPTIIPAYEGGNYLSNSYMANDTVVENDEQCSWELDNSISHSIYHRSHPCGDRGALCPAYTEYFDCPKPIKDFIKIRSDRAVFARKQFVTGAIISNWNTWLKEPSKQWAALADFICEKTTSPIAQTMCVNQGEADDNIYNNKGGTAVDYVSSNFLGSTIGEGSDFVFGTYNTNECPHGATHITDRTRCETAYQSLAANYPNHVVIGGYSGWKGRWPHGCYLNRDAHNSGVFFNIYDGGNSAGTGQPVCERDKKYRIQQTCQRDHPGHKVIATPVSYCHTDGTTVVCGKDDYKTCNWYYNSNDFIDIQPTDINHDWTCCISITHGLYVIGTAGTNDCPTSYSHVNDLFQCSAAYQFLSLGTLDARNFQQNGCCDNRGRPICSESSNQVNTATTSLVEISNDIPHNSHLPFSAMLGFLGLAMVATYKVVKDYRRHHQYHHHPHSKQYNKLDYESLMEA